MGNHINSNSNHVNNKFYRSVCQLTERYEPKILKEIEDIEDIEDIENKEAQKPEHQRGTDTIQKAKTLEKMMLTLGENIPLTVFGADVQVPPTGVTYKMSDGRSEEVLASPPYKSFWEYTGKTFKIGTFI